MLAGYKMQESSGFVYTRLAPRSTRISERNLAKISAKYYRNISL